MAETIGVRFEHGLGDCVYFAHQLPLYLRRDCVVAVSCSADKELLFQAAGVPIAAIPGAGAPVPWVEGDRPNGDLRFDNVWRWSKMARNLSLAPMPDIGHPAALWNEYCDVSLDARPLIPRATRDAVDRYLAGLKPPLILLHTHGTTDGERKNIPVDVARRICRELLARTEGTILLLDWHGNLPPWPHWRVRHLQHDFGRIGTAGLLCFLYRADLMAGIDSGPLHAARFTRTPSLGIWMRDGSPATWSLPRALQVNVVAGHESRVSMQGARVPFNVVECPAAETLPALVGRTVERMLAGCRFLPDSYLGRDILLQQFVRDWQGGESSYFGGFNDRDAGFDSLLRAAASRFARPVIVETGCIRHDEDFEGAGFSTLLLGLFAASHGGEFVSIDHDRGNCALARRVVACLGAAARVIESDSVAWLEGDARRIDVLYLDSRDADLQGSAEHGLREVQAAYERLHDASLVAWDDTCYANGAFIGSGALGVPWLLDRGWRILHSGQQTILGRGEG